MKVRLVGIWDYNSSKDILQWDGNMCRIFGTGDKSAVGDINMFSVLLHPEDIERITKEVTDTITGVNDFYDAFYTVIKPGGGEAYVHAWGSVFDHNGDVCLIGACEDVTERKELIESLEKIKNA